MLGSVNKRIYIALIAMSLSLLTACGDALIATNRPFGDAREDIKPGQTSRKDVHQLLGQPLITKINISWPAVDDGNVEIYTAAGSSVGLISIIPVPTGDIDHYALITYDESGRVSEADWNYNTYNISPWSGVFLYAGDYGYDTGTNTIFPSKDGGGKADRAWERYLSNESYYQTWARGFKDRRRSQWRNSTLSSLCHAVEQEHPAALAELGNYFWDDWHDLYEGCNGAWEKVKICIEMRRQNKGMLPSNKRYVSVHHGLWEEFDKNIVKACLWYAIANDETLPPWCSDGLTEEEGIRVERLIEDWQTSQCKTEVAPYICGSFWWGGICK